MGTIGECIPYPLPTMIEAVLLPFDGKIIYDSIFIPYNVSFGKGMRSSFKDSFDEAKAKVGIIENMKDDDFKPLCLKALAKLCRKRPSPLVSGKARTWAAGIVYAIGQQNFIFDRSQ